MEPAFVCPGVHRGLSIKMRRRIHPNNIEVSRIIGTRPDGERFFETPRGHPVIQRSPFPLGWEMIELPSFVGAGFDHVRTESDLQPPPP